MFKKKKEQKTVEPTVAPEQEFGLFEDIETRGGKINFGAPTKCPNCGDFGFVESVANGVQSNRCMHCGQTWDFTRRGLESYIEDSRAKAAEDQQAVGKGTLMQEAGLNALRVTREQFISLSKALRETKSFKKPPGKDL